MKITIPTIIAVLCFVALLNTNKESLTALLLVDVMIVAIGVAITNLSGKYIDNDNNNEEL